MNPPRRLSFILAPSEESSSGHRGQPALTIVLFVVVSLEDIQIQPFKVTFEASVSAQAEIPEVTSKKMANTQA